MGAFVRELIVGFLCDWQVEVWFLWMRTLRVGEAQIFFIAASSIGVTTSRGRSFHLCFVPRRCLY